jgi:hypothetical protein
MNPIRAVALAALLVVAAPAAAHAQAPAETSDTTKLAAPLRASMSAMKLALVGLKAAETSAHFAPDVVVEFQGMTYTGKLNAEAWLSGVFSQITSISFTASTFVVNVDEVVQKSSYTTMSPAGEQPGSNQITWRRLADGTWKVVLLVAG